jgi:hypothetical protein
VVPGSTFAVKGSVPVSAVPSPADRLERAGAFLSRSDLRELGLERRAVDAVFRACPVVALPGYSRPLIRVEDYRALIEASTFRGDRVRPS